jgi:hypothetical protein
VEGGRATGGGSDGGGAGDGGTGDGGTGAQLASLTFGPLNLAPGDDVTKCVVVRLGNTSALHIGAIRNQVSAGVLGLAVYKSTDTTEQTTPFDCRTVEDYLSPRDLLFFSRKSDDTLTMPEGIGRTFSANQMIQLEVHAFNDTSDNLAVQTSTAFTPMADASFKNEAAAFLIALADFRIPPGPYQQNFYISVPSSVTGHGFFAISAFQHKYGVGVTVGTADSATAASSSPVYDPASYDWRAPPTVYPTAPFTVPDNGGFSVTCNWNNTGTATAQAGSLAAQETCAVFGYYAPGAGFTSCTNSTVVMGATICCPNSQQPSSCPSL